MEGLFDNILYIVITIAVIAFSMMNKKKKAEEAQRRTAQKPKTVFEPFEEIFAADEEEKDEEEEILESDPHIRSIFVEPRTSNAPRNEDFNPEVKSAFAKFTEEKNAREPNPVEEQENMVDDMQYDWDSESGKGKIIDFDLRSAVIQSEILNRKY